MGLFSSIGKAVGSVFGKGSGNLLATAAGSLIGGLADRNADLNAASGINSANADLQKEFAQKGIRWRVADAKAAGIHPLYALGATPMTASPSYVGGSDMSSYGQDISRAIDATRTASERFESRMQGLQLENQQLQNEMLRNQVIGSKRALIGSTQQPPMPSVEVVPSVITAAASGNPSLEAAPPAPAVKKFVNADGSVVTWPSADAKQAVEDSLYEYEHMWHNRIVPSLMNSAPARYGRWVDDKALEALRYWKGGK